MEDFSNNRPMSFTNDIVYRARFVEEALKQGLKFGSNMFRVYHQLRWFEEEGKYGWNVANFATIGTYVNLTEEEVTVAMDKLRERGIVQHILTDKRWYRKKTDLWATTICLRRREIDYINARIGAHNSTPNSIVKLSETTPGSVETTPGSVETTPGSVETTPGGVDATPVTTESGNNNINNNRNMCSAYASPADAGSAFATQSSSADADSDDIKKVFELPFDEDVNVVNVKAIDDKKKETRRAAAIANKVADVLGRDKRQVTDVVVKNMRGVLTEYSEEEVLHMANWCKTQEFWSDKTLAQMIKKDTVAQALMNKKVENKYVW
jgi:DNA-binding Lrp family transcriptional regulator